jgi:hypothetical protein
MGETQFAWTVRQLGDLRGDVDLISGIEGPPAGTTIVNTFTEEQIIQIQDVTNNKINLSLSLDNTNPAVSYPLRVGHTYQPGVGPVGLGVGMSLEVESATEGVKESIAAFEAQATVMTAGGMTGEAGINVVVEGDPERVITFGHQHMRNHFQPEAATDHALFELGTGGTFTGPAAGTYIGAKAESGFEGDYVNFWRAGEADADFRVDYQGNVYVGGSLLGGGGGGDAFIGQSNAWSAAQTFALLTQAVITDTANTGPSASLSVEHRLSSGTPANGYGSSLDFYGEDETNARTLYGRLHTEGTAFGVAAVDADIALSQSRAGSVVEVLRFDASAGRMEIVDEIWQNAVKRRLNRSAMVVLISGDTPAGTGADAAEAVIPPDPENGSSSITWNVRQLIFRVSTAGGAPQVTVEKSSDVGVFDPTTVGSVTLGDGDYEGEQTAGFTTAQLVSGDKVRINVNTLATAEGWFVGLLLESE